MTCFSACGSSVFLYLLSNSVLPPIIEVLACFVWNGKVRLLLSAAEGSEQVHDAVTLLVESSETGMLACVVDCSQICRERSTSRRTGCEDKLWPAERDFHDQDVLIRAFPSSIGYSEGSCTVRSESQQCLDGAYEQSECITAVVDGHKSEDDGVENDSGSEEEHRCGGKGNEGNHGQVCETGHDRRLGEEAEGEVLESTKGLQLSGDKSSCRVTKSSLTIRMPATSIECLQIRSKGTQLQCAEENLRRFSEGQIEVVSAELEPSSSFGDVAESVDHINKGGGRGKEPQLAERASSSHELFRERLDVVGSRGNERGGVQLGLSSSWGDNLRGSQEHLSFQGEDTVECITNVGEDDDFGFDVEEFRTPGHGQNQEETHHTESRSEFHARGDQFHGGEDRQGTPSATFESPRAQTEKTSRGGASSRLRSSEKVLEEIHPLLDATSGRKIPQRIEAGAGRVHVGKGQEKDARGEGHLRRSEASLVSEERRVRARLDVPAAGSGRGEQTEEATKVVRPSRPSGGKDRHSKVNTAKGPRDRRVRLSVPTAVQFYDVQDRLGYDQPSKAVEWLIKKAKAAIDELGRLPARGNDGPSALSDISHASPYSADLAGPVSGSSSCPPNGSFPAALSSPFGDHIPNHMSYFIDSSVQQGMAFGNHQVHIRDVGGVSLSQAHFATGQGQLAGLSFPLGQTDLSRGNPGCAEGCKVGEFTGSPLARLESRVKARERARERVKEKCTGRDGGKVAGSGSSPSSMQSPPLHQSPIHSSFPVQNAMQSSLHNLPLQSPHPSPGPLQSSLSGVFHTTLSGIMQSSQQGTLQNLIMHNPSLQSPLTDQVQGSLQHPFQASLHSTLQNPRGQQQSHLQIPTLEGSAEGALDMESGFTPGPCSSSFSDAASLSSSDFMSISSLPTSQSLPMSHLSAFGISPSCSMGGHFATGSIAVQIPPGFSPGPPSSAFRPRPGPISQSSPKDQQQQGLSRPPGQVILPSYSTGLASPAGSPSSKASAPLYFSTASSRMGSLQSISPSALESASFSSIRNVNYDYQRGLQMMSPARTSSSYQTSNSQLQMPARIHGLDHEDFDEELTSPPPSSPHVHP